MKEMWIRPSEKSAEGLGADVSSVEFLSEEDQRASGHVETQYTGSHVMKRKPSVSDDQDRKQAANMEAGIASSTRKELANIRKALDFLIQEVLMVLVVW